jgi:hypothetical protein
VLVDCRCLESALEAVRVSVEAMRVSVETVRVSIEALKCFRGYVGKTVLKNSGTNQNVLVLFQNF